MNMRKIIAVLAAALMLMSVLPMAVFAAGENAADFNTVAANSSYTSRKTTNGWTAVNTAVLQGGTTDSNPTFKFVGSTSATRAFCINGKTSAVGKITSPTLTGGISQLNFDYGNAFSENNGVDITITITDASGTKTTKVLDNNSVSKTTKYSFEWVLDVPVIGDFVIEIKNNSPSKSTSNKDRVAIFNLTWESAASEGPVCNHEFDDCEDATCNVEGCDYERTAPGHEWADCTATECENCDATREALEHTYTSIYATHCDVCGGGARTGAALPEAGSTLTIPEANDIAGTKAHNAYTTGKYVVTGVVDSIANATYGNLYIKDAEGNKLYVYGVYSPDGKTRYDALGDLKPAVGDTITLLGVLGTYSGATQMKSGWLVIEETECEHVYFDACSPICELCGEEREVSHNVIHVEAVPATCSTNGNIEYWYCDACGAAWLDDACTLNTNLMSVVLPASCSYNAVYTAAKAATCTENGNVEHWYCETCDVYYADAACAIVTNAKNVVVAASCKYGAVYTAAKAATCDEPGNTEYWYCANCDVYYADADCTIITNAKNVIIPIAHNVIHVEAVPATCTTDGNIEYWYCDACGAAWLDELCHLNTNLKSVVLPASCSYSAVYTAAKAPTCDEPGNVEYWYCANCDVYYADAACAIVTNAKNVILPISHDIIHVEAVPATCTTDGNIEYWYCADCGAAWLDEYCHLNTNLKSVVLPASCSYTAVHTEAKAATCFEPGNTEYWYCANCDVYYADAACAIVTNAKNVIIPITHNVIHVEAKNPTCTETGNIEYWYCADCGAAWLDEYCHLNTNLMAVKLGASCKYGAEAHDAVEAGCHMNGMNAYWYCANCDVYYADADCTIVTNYKNLVIPALGGEVVHVEAKDATCSAEGNIEHWYCESCELVWADAALTQITNHKNVITPKADHEYFYACDAWCMNCYEMTNPEAAHSITFVPAKDATCTENGNIAYYTCEYCGGCWDNEAGMGMPLNRMMIMIWAQHSYDDDMDVDCNLCGDIRVIEYEVITFGGVSISEDVNGLAFRFDVSNMNLTLWEGTKYMADYRNATVTPDSTGTYKLVKMGAVVSNNWGVTYLDSVDGINTIDIAAKKVVNVGAEDTHFAIRVLNIPEANFNTYITARPYFVYENAEGEQVAVYGMEQCFSYNEVLNG